MKKMLLITSLLFFSFLNSQEIEDSSKFRNWCYAGGGISFSMGKISYNDFINKTNPDESGYEEENVSFRTLSPFLFTQLYGKLFMGEFTIGMDYEKASNSSLSHFNTAFTASVRYCRNLNDNVILFAGPGVYLETYPSSKKYDGGGIMLSAGAAFNATETLRIFSIIAATYGYYGVGDESKKIGFRFSAGAGKRVGKF
ncbi:MAG: hypothetical protein KAZ87_07380 [Spirochaetes bacterium]|nr:hypothetical protein [Spirochaetota bacterium]